MLVLHIFIINTTTRRFFIKKLYTTEARYPAYLGILAISNALSRNILSEAVPLVKSLKSHMILKASFTYNPAQNICNKIGNSSKTGEDKKSLISTLACFFYGYCQSLISGRENRH